MGNQVFQENDSIKGRYKVLSLVGKGGIGTTYRVQDTENNRIVVLKTLDLQDVKDWKEVELFQREISALKNLRHPNIPGYYDNFEVQWNGKTFYALVMEYINGKNLYEYVKQGGRFTTGEVKDVLKKLLAILCYIHDLNPPVIHRDIHPKNIIRTPEGNFFLVDFGAVGTLVADTLAASASSTFVGTIGYMPPEQLYGKSLPASDIYSLGVTMLFLLTGREPSSFQLKDMRLEYKPYIHLPGDLKQVIDRMIEPGLEKRIKSARQVLKLLKKEKIQQKQPREIKEPAEKTGTLSDLDRLVEKKKRKEDAKKKSYELAEKQKEARKKEKELREKEKAEVSPPRVFITDASEGVLMSVHQVPFLTYIRNRFISDVVTSLSVIFASSIFMIPLVIEEFDSLFFDDRFANTAAIIIIYSVVIFVGKFIHSLATKMKKFKLLLTNKNNVFLYRKNPRKPAAMGQKYRLAITIEDASFRPGGGGIRTKAWKKICFKLQNRDMKDTGFNKEDADRVREFCRNHSLNCESY